MDHSSQNIYGYTEECSSSESGWTMYIASPMNNDGSNVTTGDGGGYHSDEHRNIKKKLKNNYDDSDDSMNSDASSGPNHRYSVDGGTSHYRKDNGNNKFYSFKKKTPSMEKKREGTKVDKKIEEPVMLFNPPAASVPTSTTKSRKLKWFGKGK
ncbi:hypothetical protein C5167_005717 [Papaver somniferum]|uniref:Uncharacterized protein n=1 Tax=Papaver somniferum TaxID=3469 RepID=A0A4Y7JC70_PAPSO|nr:uncharacterized protein LOC113272608 [Papaver somniferum]RZC58407.1 hypothetical protein C5167_005717 [Papaver somniferum]